MDINRARMFIYQNARPLDLARWQYLFEKEVVKVFLRRLLFIKTRMAALTMVWRQIAGIRNPPPYRHGRQL